MRRRRNRGFLLLSQRGREDLILPLCRRSDSPLFSVSRNLIFSNLYGFQSYLVFPEIICRTDCSHCDSVPVSPLANRLRSTRYPNFQNVCGPVFDVDDGFRLKYWLAAFLAVFLDSGVFLGFYEDGHSFELLPQQRDPRSGFSVRHGSMPERGNPED